MSKRINILGKDNFVDSSADKILIVGNGNQVFGKVENIVIVGDNFTVKESNIVLIDGDIKRFNYNDAGNRVVLTDAANYNTDANTSYYLTDTTGNNTTFVLSFNEADYYPGMKFTFKKLVSNNIVIINAGAKTIDGNQYAYLYAEDDTIEIMYDGFNWVITTFPKPVFTPVANGTNFVEVVQASDLPTTLAANTTYFIRGLITLSTPRLVTNSGSAIIGFDRNKDGLIWDGAAGTTMLTITDVDFDLTGIYLSANNTGSVVIEADNYDGAAYNAGRNKILTIVNCQFRGCYDVASFEGFDLIDIQNSLFFYVKAPNFGIKVLNTSKLEISSCEFIRWFDESTLPTPSGYATASMIEILPNGAGVGVGAFQMSGCILHPQLSQNGIKINPLSTTGFATISSNTFVDANLITGFKFFPNPLTGGYSNTECLTYDVKSNQGLLNSTSGVVMTLNGNTTNTSLTVNTPSIVNTGGGAVLQASVRYTVSTAGRCTYTGTKQAYVSLHASVSYDKQGGGSDDYVFYFYKNGVQLAGSQTLVDAQKNSAISLVYGVLMVQNDYIEIWVENTQSNDNMRVTDWQVVIRE